MIGEILTGLLKANLAASVAIAGVLAVRTLVRPRFGARAAYLLWLAPLAAAVAVLTPHPAAQTLISPVVLNAAAAVDEFVAAAPASLGQGPDLAGALFGLWVLGALAGAGLLVRRQAAYLAAMGRLTPVAASRIFRAEHSGVGPAVVGVFRPRIVAPADFETRFEAGERELILAHERVHLRHGDAGANALACAVQCLCWFNPLVHLAARTLRIDQELACDAAVIGRFPAQRRTYAELLLKTQLAAQPLPLGCHWPAGAEHPLKARIAMLSSPLPERARRAMGLAVVASVTLGAGAVAWAAQPSHLEPADAARLAGPGQSVMCKPDAKRELHNCEIKGSPFAVIATAADVAREWPAQAKAKGLTGSVTLRCTPSHASQRLERCEGYHYDGAAERPELKAAFEKAAVRVISVIRLKARPGPNDFPMSETPGFYTIQFNDHPNMPGGPPATNPPTTRFPDFLPGPPTPAKAKPAPAPVSRVPVSYVAAEAAAGAQPVIVKPDWALKPTGADIVEFYPPEAVKAGVDGAATIGCAVSLEGRLTDCKVLDEAPAQAGFGAAALKLSERFQMKPMTRDGHPVSGGKIRIPIRFALPRPPQPVTPS